MASGHLACAALEFPILQCANLKICDTEKFMYLLVCNSDTECLLHRVMLNKVTHGMSSPHNECSMNVPGHRVIVGTFSSHM